MPPLTMLAPLPPLLLLSPPPPKLVLQLLPGKCKFLYRLIFTILYIPISIDDLYTIFYVPIGIDLWYIQFCIHQLVLTIGLYDFIYMKSYYPANFYTD
jgi:hypothetical protein